MSNLELIDMIQFILLILVCFYILVAFFDMSKFACLCIETLVQKIKNILLR
jgi:hypothetical protein